MQTYGEWSYSSKHFLLSTLDEAELSASRPGRFAPVPIEQDSRWGAQKISVATGNRTSVV
jgi:hypothetical protein